MVPPTHPLAQGLRADLARAHALTTEALARARTARLSRFPDHGGRHDPVSAGASLVLCARRHRNCGRKPSDPAGYAAWLAVLGTRLVRPSHRLSRLDGAWILERARAQL